MRPAEQIGDRGFVGARVARLADHRLGRVHVLAAFELGITKEVEQQRLSQAPGSGPAEAPPRASGQRPASSSALPERATEPRFTIKLMSLGERERPGVSISGLIVALHRLETSPRREKSPVRHRARRSAAAIRYASLSFLVTAGSATWMSRTCEHRGVTGGTERNSASASSLRFWPPAATPAGWWRCCFADLP